MVEDRDECKDASVWLDDEAGSTQPAHSFPCSPDGDQDDPGKAGLKRRKVNHACVYCRRSHMTCDLIRPCKRCEARGIAQLCHDEPREFDPKRTKRSDSHGDEVKDEVDGAVGLVPLQSPTRSQSPASLQPLEQLPQAVLATNQELQIGPSTSASSSLSPSSQRPGSMGPPPPIDGSVRGDAGSSANAESFGRGRLLDPVPQGGPSLGATAAAPLGRGRDLNEFSAARDQVNTGYSDGWLANQNPFYDMHNYNSRFMFLPEVRHEFNLLNDFLQSTLVDDGTLPDSLRAPLLNNPGPGAALGPAVGASVAGGMLAPSIDHSSHSNGAGVAASVGPLLPPQPLSSFPHTLQTDHGKTISRPSSVVPVDKTREYYYQAADPSGNDAPEERMQRLLEAKIEAGLLKPYNYVRGYQRLKEYLESPHVTAASRHKILRTLDRFRPSFREKIHVLTDTELIFIEMWFEEQMMEYDRVFASMAVPACLWRRTGEIYRSNKEMAELVGLPVHRLQDGKLSLHDILTEESLVRYWEEFGTIAFDQDHDTLLTACELRNPTDNSAPTVKCCFSFMIRRDEHELPTVLIGNFLPHDPAE